MKSQKDNIKELSFPFIYEPPNYICVKIPSFMDGEKVFSSALSVEMKACENDKFNNMSADDLFLSLKKELSEHDLKILLEMIDDSI